MESYVNEILSISEQLAGIGKPVDDEYIGIIMLQGLPEEYEPMTMALENTGVAITSDLVKTKLLQDKRWGQCRSEESALLVKNKGKLKKPWCWKCKSQGHYKQKCPSPGPQGQVQHNGKHGSSHSSKNKALLTALGVKVDMTKFDWFIDSGETNHMCSSSESLLNLSMDNSGQEVVVANNSKLITNGVGDVSIDLITGQVSKIENVAYVPGLATNLLSVSSMTMKGYTVVFDLEGCKIFVNLRSKTTGNVVASASEVSGIYTSSSTGKLSCRSSLSDNQACMTSKIECDSFLWHRRLGHLNQVSLNLLKNKLSLGVYYKGDATDSTPCVACIKAKQARQPFPNVKNKKLCLNRLDLIHTDLCGPMAVKSWSEKRYILTFIDDHSRMVFIYF